VGKSKYIIYFLIGLAVFGFGTMLFKNPSGLFFSLLLTVVIAFVLFKILTYVLNRRNGANSDEMKKYQQAVKQSKQKYQPQQKVEIKKKSKPSIKRKKRRKHAPHLRVIDGKKNNSNKNDRVL